MTSSAAPASREEAAALLGVTPDATAAVVQRAYLRAARRTHPDVLPDADEAGRRAAADAFDRITRARDLLVQGVPSTPSVTATAPASDRYRRGRGLGGAFVTLALLGFLLIAIVATEEAILGDPTQVPGVARTP